MTDHSHDPERVGEIIARMPSILRLLVRAPLADATAEEPRDRDAPREEPTHPRPMALRAA